MAEAAEPVPWTKPADLVYAPIVPCPLLGGRPHFNVLMVDGNVRVLAADTPEATLRALITRNGGEEAVLP